MTAITLTELSTGREGTSRSMQKEWRSVSTSRLSRVSPSDRCRSRALGCSSGSSRDSALQHLWYVLTFSQSFPRSTRPPCHRLSSNCCPNLQCWLWLILWLFHSWAKTCPWEIVKTTFCCVSNDYLFLTLSISRCLYELFNILNSFGWKFRSHPLCCAGGSVGQKWTDTTAQATTKPSKTMTDWLNIIKYQPSAYTQFKLKHKMYIKMEQLTVQ